MNLKTVFKKYTLPLVLIAWCSSALAVSLTDFQALALSGDRTQLELTFDGPAPTPRGYSIENPARISLDFRDTDSLLDSRYIQIGTGNTRNAAIVSSGGRTRIVLSLSSLVPYATAVSGNTVQIVVGEGAQDVLGSDSGPSSSSAQSASSSVAEAQPATGSTSSTVTRPTQVANDSRSELLNVDFRRSEEGTGQVILEFSNSNARTDIIERGGSIVVELEDFEVPRELRRRLDVVDFATSVHYINVYREDQNGIVELELDGAFDYLAYQTDNRMTIDVQTVTPAEAQARQEAQFPYSGDRLSLSFQDIEVRNVLQLIADYVGLNLVASDSISGNITLRLQNVPWDQALDLVLKTKGLDKRQTGNVLLVGPAQEIAERERLELESQQQAEQLAPLVTEFVQINYARAADILEVLRTGAGGAGADSETTTAEDGTVTTTEQSSSSSGFLSRRGTASADTRTNTLIIRDTAGNLDRIREAIQIFDRPVRQVLIEARVVAARTSVGKELGIRWGGNVNSGGNFPPVVASGSLDSTSSIGSDLQNSGGTSYTQSYPEALAVNLPAGGNASSFAIGVAAFDYALDLELSALETRGSAEVVSQPKIVTSDGQEAYIISGQSIPFQGAEGETIFRDAGLSLRVTPQITPDNRVVLDLVVTQDSLAAGGNAIDTNSVTTQVLVNNGDTLVLGGVYRTESVTTIDKTPLLGDLPVLGTLFRRTSSSEEKTELLIFITPKLVQEGLASN
ncbi:type IV pilus secretin PilQ [Saccharospirillum impatiens]|uniref:type IV pilus secretin PilQ n=1 Tax=Saccharospirillum impatiens TaxID=169438 RepID=UPI000409D6FF|nr:type IV pilus secretin PilQ [Saccharospirillum impatiens]